MIKFIFITSVQILILYLLFAYIPALEVVTFTGKILGLTILAIVSSAIQYLFNLRFISRYRFTLTFMTLAGTALLTLKNLPGYTILDSNKSLLIIILFSFTSVFLGLFTKRSG